MIIITKITDNLPHSTLTDIAWPHLDNLEFADSNFYSKGPVDYFLLTGIAPNALMILTGNHITSQLLQPTVFSTLFGWSWVLIVLVTSTNHDSITSIPVMIETSL